MNGELYTKLCEGLRLRAYQDQKGVWTIGYGCTGPGIGPGVVWTKERAEAEFSARYTTAIKDAASVIGPGVWGWLDEVRRAALTDMAYQLGKPKFAKFVHMLAAVRAQSWQLAHDECLASDYAHDAPARAARSAAMLLTAACPKIPF
ncbi:MAG: glycoside hydrolase family protein [Methanobacterium sp.]|nr:glycoside hydrolase family protein [Methanobacterium sp.]